MNFRKLSYLVAFSVVGIVVCLGMTIYTAVHQKKAEVQTPASSIPAPAIPRR